MSNARNKRIDPATLQIDEEALTALKTMGGYQPSNPAYSLSALTGLFDAMQTTKAAEVNAQNALDAARDAAVAAQWAYHDAILGVKDQVIAQFGPSSDQVASLGLKKKSERKAPVRREKVSA